MGRLVERWHAYWFRPAPLFNLAICRILIVGTQLSILIGSDYHNYRRFYELSQLSDTVYAPLPVLRIILWPFGSMYRPPIEILLTIYTAALASGALSLIGFKTRISLALFAVASLFLQSFSYSFHEYHHPESLMLIALALLAMAPAGAVLSADDLACRIRSNSRNAQLLASTNILDEKSSFAIWPILLMQWLLSLVYLAAAGSKLGAAGLDWLNGYTLQFYMLRDALRWSEIGIWFAHQTELVRWLSWMTILFEGTFFAVLISPVLAWVYVPLGVAFHLGIYLTMGAFFFQFMAVYSVFIDWASMLRSLSRYLRWLGPGKKVDVLFDGQCTFCIRWMTVLRYFDWFSAVTLTDSRTEWLSSDAERAHPTMPSGPRQGRFFEFRRVLWRIPALWPLLVLFYFPLASLVGGKLYKLGSSPLLRQQYCSLRACSGHRKVREVGVID